MPQILAKVAGAICDECLAPDIDSGDGSGCDNETMVVIQLGAMAKCQRSADRVDHEPSVVKLPPLTDVADKAARSGGKKRGLADGDGDGGDKDKRRRLNE